MIVKELEPPMGGDALAHTGRRAEEQMAFYLRRAFAEDAQVRVFHGLRLERGGEVCQIDHLILHRWGMIIVESKSVTSRVEINESGEWTRWWDGRMRGMPSPVLQARRQADLLRRLLADHADELLGKLLGLLQKRFGGMPLDVLAAVSDDGVIKQPRKAVEEAVCKADQVPERVRAVIARWKGEASVLGPNGKGGYSLTAAEVERISDFLMARHVPFVGQPKNVTVASPSADVVPPPAVVSHPPSTVATEEVFSARLLCRACQTDNVSVEYGRYGYFIKCQVCETNTPIKLVCSGCGGKPRVRKSGPQFFADCQNCGRSELFHVNGATAASPKNRG